MFDEVFFQMVKNRGIRYYYNAGSPMPHWRIIHPKIKFEFVARGGLALCLTLSNMISTLYI